MQFVAIKLTGENKNFYFDVVLVRTVVNFEISKLNIELHFC